MAQTSQFALLGKRRFLPFFVTQFAGAFNDNLYKNALLLLIAFSAGKIMGLSSNVVVNVAAGLFILPFFLFSALAGQIADKYEKSRLIRWVKLAEILIMAAAAVGLALGWYGLLLGLLFVMGTHSTFFGPVKYAILPQALEDGELVGGNALVEMGTFVAILLGTLTAGFLAQMPQEHLVVAGGVLITAVVGFAASLGIPRTPAADPAIRLNFNPWSETWRVVALARRSHGVFVALMGISWFWFLGAAYLTQFPNFAHQTLNGDESVVTVLLATFTVGIGLGSLLCEHLSGHRLELGIVPIGALGITLFGIDLYSSAQLAAGTGPLSWEGLFTAAGGLRILVDLLGIGVFGGVFIVPLYAYIQAGTPPERRARIIAANNILNALFMVASAVAAVVVLGVLRLSIAGFFLILAVGNAVAAALLFWQVPAFIERFAVWLLTRLRYRVAQHGLQSVPAEGPCLLVCDPAAWEDAIAISGALARPVHFVLDGSQPAVPLGRWRRRLLATVDFAEAGPAQIHRLLDQGELVCLFARDRVQEGACAGERADPPGGFGIPLVSLRLSFRPTGLRRRLEIEAANPTRVVAQEIESLLGTGTVALPGGIWKGNCP